MAQKSRSSYISSPSASHPFLKAGKSCSSCKHLGARPAPLHASIQALDGISLYTGMHFQSPDHYTIHRRSAQLQHYMTEESLSGTGACSKKVRHTMRPTVFLPFASNLHFYTLPLTHTRPVAVTLPCKFGGSTINASCPTTWQAHRIPVATLIAQKDEPRFFSGIRLTGHAYHSSPCFSR